MHPGQPAGLEGSQELPPELEGLAVTNGGAQHLAGAVDGHPGGHHQSVGYHMSPDTDLAERRVAEDVRELGVGQVAGAKGLDLLV
ncbi:hypothetical protein MALV_20520 [Mycolicibacterium alvei]|uniref:Uncharacterized protein n=1 Tax=Mycolicibacterium alvei TaxID=67081 RepID=A0A6N4UTB8_9MYCO|nr:hypothetical protein MALV_20520 [Mycolicibacterium alvei]